MAERVVENKVIFISLWHTFRQGVRVFFSKKLQRWYDIISKYIQSVFFPLTLSRKCKSQICRLLCNDVCESLFYAARGHDIHEDEIMSIVYGAKRGKYRVTLPV